MDISPRSVAHETPSAELSAPFDRPIAPQSTAAPVPAADWQQLRGEVAELRGQLVVLQQAVDDLSGEFHRRAAELDRLKDALGA